MRSTKYRVANPAIMKQSYWSQHSAYIAGFTMADGNIRVDPYPVIQYTVKKSNDYILDYIRNQFGYAGDLYYYDQHGNFNGEDVAVLHLRSNEVVYSMLELGLVPRKTYYQLPTIDICKERGYFASFVRGYFDGDGYVSQYQAKCSSRPNAPDNIRVFFVCKVRQNLVTLGEYLKAEIGIVPKIYPLGDSWRLQYGGRESLSLYVYMYLQETDALFILEKKAKFDKFLKYKGIQDNFIAMCSQCKTGFVRMHPGIDKCHKCRHK